MTPEQVNLAIRMDVSDVLVRYATGIDARDWALVRSCFTDDCDADYGDIGHWIGADALSEWMAQSHAAAGRSLHRITNQVVEADREGVRARSYVDALVLGPDNVTGTRAVGYYDDRLVRTSGGWKIAHRRFTLVQLQMDVTGGVGGPS